MNKSNLKLTVLGLFSFLLLTGIMVSCNKERIVDSIPVELHTLDNDINEISVNDPDVQVYIRARNSFSDHVSSLSEAQKNSFLEALKSGDYAKEELLGIINWSVEQSTTHSDMLNSVKGNLQENYSYLKINELSMPEFIQEMQVLFPSIGSGSRDEFQDCVDDAYDNYVSGQLYCVENNPPGSATDFCLDDTGEIFGDACHKCLEELYGYGY